MANRPLRLRRFLLNDKIFLSMCNYKNLVHTEYGYVVRCNSCGHLHAAFGTTILRFTEQEFLSFVKEVEHKLSTHKCTWNKKSKSIQIETANKNIGLVYSYIELKEFAKLLETATDELSREQLYNFCEN